MGKKSLVSTDDVNFELVDPGTIRIDCSGAFIGNDHLLRDDRQVSTPLTNSPKLSPAHIRLNSDDNLGGTTDNSLSSTSSSSEDSDSENIPSISKSANNTTTKTGDDFNITKNITLPQHNSSMIHMSVDIGGTLTKLVYFSKSSSSVGGRLHFKDFQTEHFGTQVLKYMIKLVNNSLNANDGVPITYVMATGGGAHKFNKFMTRTFAKHDLPVKIIAKDEMECLIRGLDWLITKIPNEIFIYDLQDNSTKFLKQQAQVSAPKEDIYPYLLVNIGSGVSMIKVTGPGRDGFERIGGSSLGGGTLWGLLSLLTEAKNYNEMLEMALRGNNENIDLLVGDIYGTNYNKIGLKSNHIASSFAKVFKKLRFFNNEDRELTPIEKLSQFRQEDIARSLLYMISNNIGQISYLQAQRYKLKRIYFGGSYILGHKQTIHTLSYAINFWSGGDMKSYFLRHEGYLGSVGAFIMGPDSPKSSTISINETQSQSQLQGHKQSQSSFVSEQPELIRSN